MAGSVGSPEQAEETILLTEICDLMKKVRPEKHGATRVATRHVLRSPDWRCNQGSRRRWRLFWSGSRTFPDESYTFPDTSWEHLHVWQIKLPSRVILKLFTFLYFPLALLSCFKEQRLDRATVLGSHPLTSLCLSLLCILLYFYYICISINNMNYCFVCFKILQIFLARCKHTWPETQSFFVNLPAFLSSQRGIHA